MFSHEINGSLPFLLYILCVLCYPRETTYLRLGVVAVIDPLRPKGLSFRNSLYSLRLRWLRQRCLPFQPRTAVLSYTDFMSAADLVVASC